MGFASGNLVDWRKLLNQEEECIESSKGCNYCEAQSKSKSVKMFLVLSFTHIGRPFGKVGLHDFQLILDEKKSLFILSYVKSIYQELDASINPSFRFKLFRRSIKIKNVLL